MLLIQFYVAGRFDIFAPDSPKLANYSNKNKDIAVKIPVRHHEFHYVSDSERRKFVANSILNAIELVRSRLEKRKLNIDFNQLQRDAEAVCVKYLMN